MKRKAGGLAVSALVLAVAGPVAAQASPERPPSENEHDDHEDPAVAGESVPPGEGASDPVGIPVEADHRYPFPEVDDSTGYYVMFSMVATAMELFGGVALGFGASELDVARRRGDLPAMALPEDDAWYSGDLDDLTLSGGLVTGIGLVSLGLGSALDVILAMEFSRDEDWWLRPCVTTPVAVLGLAMVAAGGSRLTYAEDLRVRVGYVSSRLERSALVDEAGEQDVWGRVLVSMGAAAVVGAAAAFLMRTVLEEDEGGGMTLLPGDVGSGTGLVWRLAL